jgi:hypothetical protein
VSDRNTQFAKLLQEVPFDLLATEYNRRVAKMRKASDATGRPRVLRPCPKCGKEFGARALRAHAPGCGGE